MLLSSILILSLSKDFSSYTNHFPKLFIVYILNSKVA